RGIVKGEVAVFADPNQSYIDRSSLKGVSDISNDFRRVLFSVEEMVMRDANFVDQTRQEIVSETGRMSRWQPDVFVEMKHFDVFPVNAWQAGESVQQFELGRAGCRDHAGAVALLDRPANGIGSLMRGGPSK